MRSLCFAFIVLIILTACSDSEREINGSKNIFQDSVVTTIYDLQNLRDYENLSQYFFYENPLHRKLAVEAAGSIQDFRNKDDLISVILKDKSVRVRKAAAYALGQLYDSALVDDLFQIYYGEDSTVVSREILIALGKCLTQKDVQKFSSLNVEDEIEEEGYAWGIYHGVIRNVFDFSLIEKAPRFLKSERYRTRLAGAFILGRVANTDLSEFFNLIKERISEERSVFVKMELVNALGNIPTEAANEYLNSILESERDYRIRLNALKALNKLSNETSIWEKYFGETNVNLAIQAVILSDLSKLSDAQIKSHLGKDYNFRIKAKLYEEALKRDPAVYISKIDEEIEGTNVLFEKSAFLSSLKNTEKSLPFLLDKFNDASGYLKIEIFSVIRNIKKSMELSENQKASIKKAFLSTLESKDPEVLKFVLWNATDSTLFDKSEIYPAKEWDAFYRSDLLKRNEKLKQRADILLEYLNGYSDNGWKEFQPTFKSIDWDRMKSLESDTKVIISTDKGSIIIRLLVEKAPASVDNFLQLVEEGFYEGMEFHRVVPNWVIQAGINPSVSSDEIQTIRSEFSNLFYEEGTVGMASAGKDTESTHWFITHRPTPRLNGKYSVFARVINGMDVVHEIEVGDKINTISIFAE